MLGDIERLGMRGALEHWERTGQMERTTLQMLEDRDIAAMERAVEVVL